MKLIHIENGIVIYYGNRVGTVTDGQAVVDPMFRGDELNYFLSHQRNIREVQWMDGMFDRLANGPKDLLEQPTLRNVWVWQSVLEQMVSAICFFTEYRYRKEYQHEKSERKKEEK